MKRKPTIYSAFIIMLTITLIILLTGCVETPPTKECTSYEKFEFSTISDSSGKTRYVLNTSDGPLIVPDEVYEDALTFEWESICYTTTEPELTYHSAIIITDKPAPIEVEVIVEVITEVITEVIVTETIEVPIYTHDLIDPNTWVASDHTVYYYFLYENIIHLVYTQLDSANHTLDMYTISIMFSPNLIFSDKVMVSSITHHTSLGVEGIKILSNTLTDTSHNTIVEFVEDYIATHTFEEIKQIYETVD